jgi:dihydrofolate synthase / folylpolyglutamate synthase
MRFATLNEWLAWQETLHVRAVDLGLERVRGVLERMDRAHPACPVVTVGGTNGKGSSVAMLESILGAAGYRVGAYSSPHLLRYNERVRIAGREAEDTVLCRAFDRVDQARGDVTLTYFEFATLAALDIFHGARPDLLVLEVGLGGRLDAVNAVDADVALLTSIGLDHTEWLGPDRDSVGREKAGIMRSGHPAVCADPHPPAGLMAHAEAIGAPLYRLGCEFGFQKETNGWCWWGPAGQWRGALPPPSLYGDFQLQNAAGVLMVLELLADRFPVGQDHLRQGLSEIKLKGRFQIAPGPVERIFDVAHNADSAAALARSLRQRPCSGHTFAVLAVLADKDVGGMASSLAPLVRGWYCAGLAGPRGQSGAALAARLAAAGVGDGVSVHDGVADAYRAALAEARSGDRVVVFGSFYAVAQVAQAPLAAAE